MNLAVFASGQGTIFKYLLESEELKNSPLRFSFLLSDNHKAPVLEIANRYKVKNAVFSPSEYKSFSYWDQSLCDLMCENQIDAIFLLGFLKLIGPKLLEKYRGRIFNTHPSLLPKFGGKGMYGLKVHQAVIDSKCTVTGVTIHEVDAHYDQGRILLQQEVPVLPTDDAWKLQERVKECEKELVKNFLLQYETVSKSLTKKTR